MKKFISLLLAAALMALGVVTLSATTTPANATTGNDNAGCTWNWSRTIPGVDGVKEFEYKKPKTKTEYRGKYQKFVAGDVYKVKIGSDQKTGSFGYEPYTSANGWGSGPGLFKDGAWVATTPASVLESGAHNDTSSSWWSGINQFYKRSTSYQYQLISTETRQVADGFETAWFTSSPGSPWVATGNQRWKVEPVAAINQGPVRQETSPPNNYGGQNPSPAVAWVKDGSSKECPDTGGQSITFCHAVNGQGETGNGFNLITTDVHAFYQAGHVNHEGDIYPAGAYEKNGQTFSWSAQGNTALIATNCGTPTDHNWQYNVDCTGVSGTNPNGPIDSVDSNVRIKNLTTDTVQTFNYHPNTGGPATFSWTYLGQYGMPASWTYYEVQWVQVNGTNYHWEGSLTCGEPVFVPETQRETQTRTGEPDCAAGTVTTYTEERTRTEVSDGVWGEWSGWKVIDSVTRDATQEECPPDDEQPNPLTRSVPGSTQGCDLREVGGVLTWTDVYTTPYVMDEETGEWVLGEETGPVRTNEVFTPYSDAEYQRLCAGTHPSDLVVYGQWVDGTWDCDDTTVTQTRVVSVTPFVWDEETRDWVKGVTTVTTQTGVRNLLPSEITKCISVPTPPVAAENDCDSAGFLPVAFTEGLVTKVNDEIVPEGGASYGPGEYTITYTAASGYEIVGDNQPVHVTVLDATGLQQDEDPSAECYVERPPTQSFDDTSRQSCKLGGVETESTVTTTTYEFIEETQSWKGNTSTSTSTSFDKYTDAELVKHGCVDKPHGNPPHGGPNVPTVVAAGVSGDDGGTNHNPLGGLGLLLAGAALMAFTLLKRTA